MYTALSNTLPVDPSGSYVSNFARTRSRFNTNDAATVGLSILDTLPVLSYFLPTKPVERTNPQLKLQLRNYSCQAAVRCSLNAPPRSTHYNTGQAWSMPSLAVRDLQLNLNSWLDWKPENSDCPCELQLLFCGMCFSSHQFFTQKLIWLVHYKNQTLEGLVSASLKLHLGHLYEIDLDLLRGRICLATCLRSSQNRDFRDINESFPRYFGVPTLKSIPYIPKKSHETIYLKKSCQRPKTMRYHL